MTAYNPPLYSGIPDFNTTFFTSTNVNNYLTYPVSQQTNETFLGSVNINQKLTVSGVLTATNAGSLVQSANTVLVQPSSSNVNYFFPMIPNVTSGIKVLYVDGSSGLFYNPSTDILTSNHFKANGDISTNSYLGLTSASIINFGTLTNYYNMNCTGNWPTAVLSAITPSLTINSGSINGDSILKLQTISNGSGYIGMNGLNIGLSIEVDATTPMITIGNNNLTSLWLGNGNGLTTLFGNTNLPVNAQLTYNNFRFHNTSKTRYTNFSDTTQIPITTWKVITSTTNILQAGLVCRQITSQIRITVNIPFMIQGTSTGNSYTSLVRSTIPFTSNQILTTDLVTPNTGVLTGSQYGLVAYIYQSDCLYHSKNFTFIDDTITFVAGSSYYYAVVMRQAATASVGSNVGNNSYVDITVEELF